MKVNVFTYLGQEQKQDSCRGGCSTCEVFQGHRLGQPYRAHIVAGRVLSPMPFAVPRVLVERARGWVASPKRSTAGYC